MRKMPTIFVRNYENMGEILDEQHHKCEWVFFGEGVARRKYDGTCCKVESGTFWKRREVKPGKKIPVGFVEEQFDLNTGKRIGWMPVKPADKQDKYHCEAFNGQKDGTYELIGPKIQGNPEGIDCHVLVSHAKAEIFEDCPRDFDGLKKWLANHDIEGIVFHHSDGRMAKIKKRDFALKR